MREYASGNGTVRKSYGKWQGIIRYRECETGENGETVKGPWKMKSKLFDIASYPDNNRGQKTAETELRKWRSQLIAEEPERAKREQAEREAREAAERGEIVVSPEMTVADYMHYYLYEILPKYGGRNHKMLEASTLSGYRAREHYITEGLGAIKLCDLTRDKVQVWVDGLTRGHAPIGAKNILTVLKGAMAEAVDRELIDKNPASNTALPPSDDEPNFLDSRARAALTADLDETLNGAQDRELLGQSTTHALGIKLALLTGMRQGEICALQWRDVDLARGTITVRASIGRTAGSGCYVKAAKNKSSMRTIPVTDAGLMENLRTRKAKMHGAAGAAGVRLPETVFVIGTPDGDYMRPVNLYKAFRRRCQRLGIVGTNGTPPKFHDLRHTFATVMAHSGVPAANLKALMGHTSINTTYRYYIGVDDEANRRAMELAMQGMFEGPADVVEFPATGTEG